jgi:hypothetical protein
MSLSNGVLEQVKRLQTTGAFAVNAVQKQEIARFTKENGLRELQNLDCSTCVRDSLYSIGRYLQDQTKTPRLLKDKMVKRPKDMKRPELMKACKDKGIKFDRYAKNTELIKLLKNG